MKISDNELAKFRLHKKKLNLVIVKDGEGVNKSIAVIEALAVFVTDNSVGVLVIVDVTVPSDGYDESAFFVSIMAIVLRRLITSLSFFEYNKPKTDARVIDVMIKRTSKF